MHLKNIFFAAALTGALFFGSCKQKTEQGAQEQPQTEVSQPAPEPETSQPVSSTAGLTSSSFHQMISSGKPVLADFSAVWCGPCNKMKPFMEKLSEEYKDKIHFQTVDVDAHADIAKEYNIEGMPTLILFKDGKIIWQNLGYMDEAKVREVLDANVKG